MRLFQRNDVKMNSCLAPVVEILCVVSVLNIWEYVERTRVVSGHLNCNIFSQLRPLLIPHSCVSATLMYYIIEVLIRACL